MPSKKTYLKATVLSPLVRKTKDGYRVTLCMAVRDESPAENGRQTVHDMTPAVARQRAAQLLAAADEAEQAEREDTKNDPAGSPTA